MADQAHTTASCWVGEKAVNFPCAGTSTGSRPFIIASLTSLTARDPPRVSGVSEGDGGAKISGSPKRHRFIPNTPDESPTRSMADVGPVNRDAGLMPGPYELVR